MFSQNDLEKMRKETLNFFKNMTFEVSVEFSPQKDLTLPINLKTEEPQILIGERGQTLAEIQHLLKAVLKRKLGIKELFYIDLDVNDYKKKKNEYLKELARSAADDVTLTKKEKILAPMPAYERRIIHLELADRTDITTESIGQEPERRVAVRLRP